MMRWQKFLRMKPVWRSKDGIDMSPYERYRHVDRPTDVLSFALDEGGEDEPELLDAPEEHLLGDIIISAETAQRQGEEFGHGLTREVVYLAVHGLLHLLGYDHMTEEDKVVMRAKEEEALREIELSEEFLEGGR